MKCPFHQLAKIAKQYCFANLSKMAIASNGITANLGDDTIAACILVEVVLGQGLEVGQANNVARLVHLTHNEITKPNSQ